MDFVLWIAHRWVVPLQCVRDIATLSRKANRPPPHSLTRTGAASSSEFNLFAWIKTSPFGGDWRFDSVPIPVGPKDRQRQTERRQTGIQTATQRQRQRQRGPRVMSPRDYFAPVIKCLLFRGRELNASLSRAHTHTHRVFIAGGNQRSRLPYYDRRLNWNRLGGLFVGHFDGALFICALL